MRYSNAVRQGMLAVAVAAALGFGAAQALAAPAEQGTARSCNARKADKLPGEAGMKLRFTPYVPAWDQLHRPGA